MELDCVRIGSTDVAQAVRDYSQLLDCAPMARDDCYRFDLERGAVELESAADSGLRALRFRVAPHEREAMPPHFNGLLVHLETADGARPAPHANRRAIDHVVIQSTDLEAAITLWRDRLGVRLALDRTFPERGLRILFFRSGGVTLELVGAAAPRATEMTTGSACSDRLSGLAYRVPDVSLEQQRLRQAGFDVSEVRPGQKRGTRVATVRSSTAEVPTLLIEHTERPAVDGAA